MIKKILSLAINLLMIVLVLIIFFILQTKEFFEETQSTDF